jgi:hypothetical protein
MSVMNAGGARSLEAIDEQNGGAVTFSRVMRVLGAVPLLVGLSHIVFGITADGQLGAVLTPDVVSDPVLDSQDRFYGAAFMGYGALLYLCLTDLKRYAGVFRLMCAFIVLGGVARLLSIMLRGLPPPPVLGLVGVELVLVPLIVGWHSRVLARR